MTVVRGGRLIMDRSASAESLQVNNNERDPNRVSEHERSRLQIELPTSWARPAQNHGPLLLGLMLGFVGVIP